MRKVSKAEANRRCWLLTIVVVIAIVVAVADVGKAAVAVAAAVVSATRPALVWALLSFPWLSVRG